MDPLIVLSLLVGFFLTLFFIPLWIKGTKKAGLMGKDMHKNSEKKISEAGGVAVLFGFLFGILSYIAVNVFYFKTEDHLIEIFAMLTSILIIGFIGLMDDILGWKIGLTKKTRLLFLVIGAIPLIVINAGESVAMGIQLGLLYPLLFVPLGIVGAAASFNFLAGYNGLETSQGILILSGLAFVAWSHGAGWVGVVALLMVVSLLAFYLFNKHPSKVFPGDILTYSVGGLIAIVAILGNMEKIAIFFFIPYIIQTILKSRGKLVKESFGKLNPDGSLDEPYKKIYGLEHLAIKILKRIKPSKKAYEKEVVFLINGFQIVIIILGILILL